MYEQIIVPLDRSEFAENALPIARSLTTAFGAQLELIHVAFTHSPSEEQAYLEAIASSMRIENVVTHVERGWPVPVLAELVRSRSNPIVCLATHGRTGVGGLVLGSVADELLPQVTGPLVMTGPGCDPNRRRQLDAGGAELLVCFDGSEVSASIASLATAWAHALQLMIRVAIVLHRDGTFLGNLDATVPKQRAYAFTEQLAASGVPATLDLLDGLDPARAIAAHAASLPVALVMTSTHGSGGLRRTALGSIALRIAHHAPCPVVVRRPSDEAV